MIVLNRSLGWCAAVFAAIVMTTGSVIVIAQASNNATDLPALAGIAAEIRNLRIAFEEASRRQSETQALAVYFSAQQSRMVQLSGQLNAAQKELGDQKSRLRQVSAELSRRQEDLSGITMAEGRGALERHLRVLKQEVANVAAQEQAAHHHEVELSNVLELENARWADLVSRMEALVRK